MSEERQNHEETSTMTTYEYHIQPVSLGSDDPAESIADALNFLGAQGWELVAVTDPTIDLPLHGTSLLHYFRRVRQSEE